MTIVDPIEYWKENAPKADPKLVSVALAKIDYELMRKEIIALSGAMMTSGFIIYLLKHPDLVKTLIKAASDVVPDEVVFSPEVDIL